MDTGNICNIQLVKIEKEGLTVAAEAKSVVPLPGGQLGSVVVAISFSETTVLFSDAGETASLPALVYRLGYPVDPRVAANLYAGVPSTLGETRKPSKTYGLVIRIDEDDLVILVDTVLVNPVRVQDSQVTTTPANAFLRNTP